MPDGYTIDNSSLMQRISQSILGLPDVYLSQEQEMRKIKVRSFHSVFKLLEMAILSGNMWQHNFHDPLFLGHSFLRVPFLQ